MTDLPNWMNVIPLEELEEIRSALETAEKYGLAFHSDLAERVEAALKLRRDEGV